MTEERLRQIEGQNNGVWLNVSTSEVRELIAEVRRLKAPKVTIEGQESTTEKDRGEPWEIVFGAGIWWISGRNGTVCEAMDPESVNLLLNAPTLLRLVRRIYDGDDVSSRHEVDSEWMEVAGVILRDIDGPIPVDPDR